MDHMTDEQKEDYRQHLFDILGNATKEELKIVPPVTRMRKVDKHVMDFVSVSCTV